MTKKLIILVTFVMLFTTVFAGNTTTAFATSGEETQVETTETTETPVEKTTEKPVEKKVAAVKGLKATLYASNIVTVSWKKSKNVTGYVIYEKEGKGYDQLRIVRDLSKNSIKVKNIKKGMNHKYAIRAYVKKNNKLTFSPYTHANVFVPKVLTKNTKGFNNTTAGKLIRTAKTKIGSRYVSGAQGPNQFDCSGYVYYITKTADVSTKKITRTSSASMWNNLKKHSIGTKKLSKAQPGDIVFLSATPNSRISHVAFYYGDDQYIHATSPGVGVAVTPTRYYGHVQGIVRLPNM